MSLTCGFLFKLNVPMYFQVVDKGGEAEQGKAMEHPSRGK